MSTTGRAVKRYLSKVERALQEAGVDRRREIVGEIETHVREELSQIGGDPTETQVRSILDQVGEPDEIAAQEGGASTGRSPVARLRDLAAVTLLLVGGLMIYFPLGWLAGVALLWWSDSWTVRDKILGTSVVPLGLALPIYAWISGCGTSNPVAAEGGTRYVCDWLNMPRELMIGIVVLLTLAALGMAAYLCKKLRSSGAGYWSRSVLTSRILVVLIAAGAIGWFSTTETLLKGAGKEGAWKVVASWRFQYCLTYQHALGEGGACGLTQAEKVGTGPERTGLKVFLVDDPYSVFSGLVPQGVERIDLVTASGRHIRTEFSRVLNMTFYAALVPGTPRVEVVAFDGEGNILGH